MFIDGKRFPEVASPWANPFKVDKGLKFALGKFEGYMRAKLDEDEQLRAELLALRGKTLGCWCKPSGCHGDILLELIEELVHPASSASASSTPLKLKRKEPSMLEEDNETVKKPKVNAKEE